MDENEKRILEKIAEAYPTMSEFQRGYLLGVAESEASRGKNGDNDCPAA